MRAWGLVALPLVGCDVIFGLDGRRDAAIDVAAEIDGSSCESRGHDEDGDGHDDACDVCPAVPDSEQLDGDADGVGDMCDPAPQSQCQRRRLFDGFGLPTTALKTTQWVAAEDDLLQADPTANRAIVHWLTPGPRLRVEAELTVLGFDSSQNAPRIDVGSDVQIVNSDQTINGAACRLQVMAPTMPNTVQVVLVNLDTSNQAGLATVNTDGTSNVGRVRVTFDADRWSCRVAGPNAQGTTNMASLPTPPLGEVMVRVQDLAVRLHWIDVLEPVCP